MSQTSTEPHVPQVVTEFHRFPDVRPPDVLMLLDQVDDRDRAMLAMLLEDMHPDDIAATLGISASAFRRRLVHVIDRLQYPSTRRASPARLDPVGSTDLAGRGGRARPG
jgi:DNA-directed RNA polymerase specialized sigma24 family protein